jgi:hypothetical protein
VKRMVIDFQTTLHYIPKAKTFNVVFYSIKHVTLQLFASYIICDTKNIIICPKYTEKIRKLYDICRNCENF